MMYFDDGLKYFNPFSIQSQILICAEVKSRVPFFTTVPRSQIRLNLNKNKKYIRCIKLHYILWHSKFQLFLYDTFYGSGDFIRNRSNSCSVPIVRVSM